MRIFGFQLLLFLAAVPGFAAAQAPERQITGQVRLGGQAAPAGVAVAMQIVSGKYVVPSNEREVAQTLTDSGGRFTFDHLETIGHNHGREFFAVTARTAGYTLTYRVVDLTLVARGEVSLDMRKVNAGQEDSFATSPESPMPESISSHQIPNTAAKEHLDLAEELLFRKHDPHASIPEFKLAVKADPWYGQGYVLLGLAFMQIERWGDAQLAFSEAVKVDPGNAQGFLGLGSALNEQHDYSAAQKALEHSLELKPDSAEAQYELARTLCSIEKWQAAEPHARRAIELNSDYPGPHALMGDIFLEEQDLASARHEFQEYLRLDPDGSLAYAAKQMIAEIDKALAPSGKPDH